MRPRGWRGEPGPRGEATGGRRGGGGPRGRRGPGQREARRGGGRSGADGRDGCVGRIICVHLLWPPNTLLSFSFLQKRNKALLVTNENESNKIAQTI